VAAAAAGELLETDPDCPGARRPFPAGTPRRGPFSAALTFTPPAASHSWTVEAFEVSAEDGQIVYSVQLPIWVGR
jgi:hypothetical protein